MANKKKPVKAVKPDVDVDKLHTYNWQYYIDYDYDSDHNCEGEGCNDEGICRCGTITDTRIKSIDIDSIARDICGDKDNIVLNYCVNRILNHSQMRNTDSWSLEICGGYYGQEIDGALIDKSAIPSDKLKELLSFKNSDTDMVKIALINEYGYVLPELENVNFSVVKVPLKNIIIGQDHYYKKLDRAIVKRYSSFDLPLGICVQADDERFRLIDGYHRIAAANDSGKKIVEVIIGSK